MNISHIDLLRKAPRHALRSPESNRMRERLPGLALHGAAGLLIAAFLAPEGSALTLAGVACVAGGKAIYDYVNKNENTFANAGALIAGGVVVVLASLLF